MLLHLLLRLTRLIENITHYTMESVELYCNMRSIRQSPIANPQIFFTQGVKHWSSIHFIREKVLQEENNLIKVDTNEQLDATFTKVLLHVIFELLIKLNLVLEVRTREEC